MQNCIACNSKAIKVDGNLEGYIQGSYFMIYSCFDCGTKWASPHSVDSKVYDLIYSHRNEVPGYMRYEQYAKDILTEKNPLQFLSRQEEMYYSVARSIQANTKQGKRILDVGCGLGYMTYALSEAGYQATGLDISKEAINQAKERYGNYFVCEDFFLFKGEEGGYDAICMLELIEHVEKPSEYIMRALSLLKQDGIIIITTPNRNWYSHDVLWESELPPVHLTWFSEKGIELLSKKLLLSSSFFSFSFYNIFYGTLCRPPFDGVSFRQSLFSKDGKPLYVPYIKSKIRAVTEQLHIYATLKFARYFFYKIAELLRAIISPSSLALSRSNILCVTLRRK